MGDLLLLVAVEKCLQKVGDGTAADLRPAYGPDQDPMLSVISTSLPGTQVPNPRLCCEELSSALTSSSSDRWLHADAGSLPMKKLVPSISRAVWASSNLRLAVGVRRII